MNNPQLFSAIVAVMILTGGAYYVGKDQNSGPEKKATIEANNNTIIQIGGGMVDLEGEEFRALIENAVEDKDKLAKDAVRIVKPAKRDPQALIEFSGHPGLRISSDTVKAMPDNVQEPDKEEQIEDYEELLLELRAIDLDSTKRGWGVVAPDLSPRRVKLQLDPTVNPEDLFDKRQVRGSVTVIFGFDKTGQKFPRLIFLREIVEENS